MLILSNKIISVEAQILKVALVICILALLMRYPRVLIMR